MPSHTPAERSRKKKKPGSSHNSRHDLGESFDSPSTSRKFFPSVTLKGTLGEVGSNVSGSFHGRISGTRIDNNQKVSTSVELRSLDIPSEQKAIASVAAMLRKQGSSV